MAIKPVVDRLEDELRGELLVIRINIQDPVGRQLAAEYGFQFTPTFIFFDAEGRETWRSVGQLNPAQVREALSP